MTANIDSSATVQDGVLTVYGTVPMTKRGKYTLDKEYNFSTETHLGTFKVFKNRKGVDMWKVQIPIGMNITFRNTLQLAKRVRELVKASW